MRSYVICSVFIILGLVAITWKTHLQPTSALLPYVDQLPGVFLVSGVLSLLYKVIEERESRSQLLQMFRIHDSIEQSGFSEIWTQSQAYDFTPMLHSSDNVTVVLNDGLRWVGNNAVELTGRFDRKGTITELFTIDPNGPVVPVLASKIDITAEALSEKIRSTWRRLEQAYEKSEKRGHLVIYALRHFPTRSIFHTTEQTLITPYQCSCGRTNVPVLVYKKVLGKNTVYDFVERDIQQLRIESKKVFPPPDAQPNAEGSSEPRTS